jgi:hypothetical protein
LPAPSTAFHAANLAHIWPPAHLVATNARFLNNPKIRSRLSGVSWVAKGTQPEIPNEASGPLQLLLFLGWLAAVHTPPPPRHKNKLSLFVVSITFFTNRDRQAWYETSGHQS